MLRRLCRTTRAQLEAVFRGILNQYPQIGPIDLSRLRWTDQIVTEAQDGDTSLSAAILDACFPHADTTVEYVHYTKFETLESVAQSGAWRLYWIYRRISEAEFATFAREHNLDGYFARDHAVAVVEPHAPRQREVEAAVRCGAEAPLIARQRRSLRQHGGGGAGHAAFPARRRRRRRVESIRRSVFRTEGVSDAECRAPVM